MLEGDTPSHSPESQSKSSTEGVCAKHVPAQKVCPATPSLWFGIVPSLRLGVVFPAPFPSSRPVFLPGAAWRSPFDLAGGHSHGRFRVRTSAGFCSLRKRDQKGATATDKQVVGWSQRYTWYALCQTKGPWHTSEPHFGRAVGNNHMYECLNPNTQPEPLKVSAIRMVQ